MLDDFTALFEELGVLAVAGSQSAMVLFDTPDDVREYAVSSSPQITYPTGALSLAEEIQLTVAGVAYEVRQVAAVDDGLLTVAQLREL